MQVDDEHLSLTDQKDQVRDPLQVHVPGREARGQRGLCGWTRELWWTDPCLSTPPRSPLNGASLGCFSGGLSQLQTLSLTCRKQIGLSQSLAPLSHETG